MKKTLDPAIVALATFLFCATCLAADNRESDLERIDELFEGIEAKVEQRGLKIVAAIDHSRLAAETSVEMPPSRVLIFSNPEVNSHLMRQDVLVGVDLPYRVLSYLENNVESVIFADADYLQKRHGLHPSKWLDAYQDDLKAATAGVNPAILRTVPVTALNEDYGFVDLMSEFDFTTTIERLRSAVMGQGDTVWFAEIDYAREAAEYSIELPNSKLLLFGAPEPGGVAMASFPSIGLDAFCQKVLVYEDSAKQVHVVFNDIEAVARLHYGSSIKPHEVINGRLINTFTTAITRTDK